MALVLSLFLTNMAFQANLNLKKKANPLQALKKAGIGYTPGVTCNVDPSRNSQLHEIYLCVDVSGSNLVECPVFPRGKCASRVEFPSF
ncbi:Ribonuclease T2-like [Parasponia andersonii]|uniref:Ribonuclease T2-like n=1 Tax=Parasponia andersonii TaxID=3476 RepID=A0A2P5CB93_PARAD|nr:Ribonuclease T2-like [Parasponia andersonii]